MATKEIKCKKKREKSNSIKLLSETILTKLVIVLEREKRRMSKLDKKSSYREYYGNGKNDNINTDDVDDEHFWRKRESNNA